MRVGLTRVNGVARASEKLYCDASRVYQFYDIGFAMVPMRHIFLILRSFSCLFSPTVTYTIPSFASSLVFSTFTVGLSHSGRLYVVFGMVGLGRRDSMRDSMRYIFPFLPNRLTSFDVLARGALR